MENKKIWIKINPGPITNSDELESLTITLREELLELDNIICEIPIDKNKPKHSKGGDAFAWGELVLTLLASGGVLTSILTVINSWVNRNKNSKIIIKIQGNEIELEGKIDGEKASALEKWIKRYIEE